MCWRSKAITWRGLSLIANVTDYANQEAEAANGRE